MNSSQKPRSTGKTILIVLLAAITMSVLSTLIQVLVLGKANVAITGGVVGALTALLALKAIKKTQKSEESKESEES